jgi:hypothetical protein
MHVDFLRIDYAFMRTGKNSRCKSKREEIMKQNRSSKQIRSYRGRARPSRTGVKIIPALILVLILLSVPVSFAPEAAKTDRVPKEKAARLDAAEAHPVAVKIKGAVAKELTGLKTGIKISKDDNPAEKIHPVELPGTQVPSGSAVRDKGRQIKWQILCTGGNCGAGNVVYLLGASADYHMCGTIGQTSVGPGSSPSYDVNSGFWQDFLGGFLRGDANGDGIIDLEDVIYLINYLYRCGPPPSPLEAGNSNCDGVLGVGDVVYLINYLLREGPRPSC